MNREQIIHNNYIRAANTLLAEYAFLLGHKASNDEKVIRIIKARDNLELMYKKHTTAVN